MNNLPSNAQAREPSSGGATPLAAACGLTMSSQEALVGQIADEFTQRLNQNEQPDIEEYARRYPEIASVLREVLAALLVVRVASLKLPTDTSESQAPAALTGCLGDFRIAREVGRGGMGVVYEAEQVSLGRKVALKVLPFAATLDPKQLQRFKNEARAAAYLHHPHIVPVYAVGFERGLHYYAMQYIEGQSLAAVIVALRFSEPASGRLELPDATTSPHAPPPVGEDLGRGGPGATRSPDLTLSADTHVAATLSTHRSTKDPAYFCNVARLGIQAAEALEYAHSFGIVHRDIKPGNLLLQAPHPYPPPLVGGGEGGELAPEVHLWVTDFGLAQVQSDPRLTITGDLVGTLRYMSPEQALAKHGLVDHRTDVYSLGVTLYELLALRPAFDGEDRNELLRQVVQEEPPALRRLNPVIPTELETIVLKAMAKDPAERYATAKDLADDLNHWLRGEPIQARSVGRMSRLWRWCRRNPTVAWLTGSVAALLLVIATVSPILTILAIDAKEKLELQHQATDEERDRAEQAERQLREKRLDTYLAKLTKARAIRLGHQPGQRLDCLKALQEATQSARSLNFGEEQFLDLRNEAIACLALPDLRLRGQEWHVDVLTSDRLDFDSELERYVVVDAQGTAVIRRVTDHQVLRSLPNPGLPPDWAVPTFSPDGRYLAVLYSFPNPKMNQACFWDLSKNTTAPDLTLSARNLYFLPEGHQVIAALQDGSLGLVDLKSRLEVRHWSPGLVVATPDFPIAGNVEQIIVGNRRDRMVRMLDLKTEQIQALGTLPEAVVPRRIAWHPEGRIAAVAGEDWRIYVYSIPDWRPLQVLEGHQNQINGLAFTKFGNLLLSHSWDDSTILWDALAGRKVLQVRGLFGRLSKDGRQMPFQDQGRVGIWELTPSREFTVLHQSTITAEFSPDGSLLATAGNGVGIWETAGWRQLQHLALGPCAGVVFEPDGGRLVTFGSSGLRLWPLSRGPGPRGTPVSQNAWQLGPPDSVFLQGLQGHLVWARVAYTRQGRLVAGDFEGVPGVFLNPDRPAERVFLCGPCKAFALSPSKPWIAGGAWRSNQIWVWNLTTNQMVRELPGSKLPSNTNFAAFSPDGQWLVTSEPDAHRFWRVGEWDAHDPRPAACDREMRRDGIEGSGSPMAFSPDGRMLALGKSIRLVQLVDPTTGKELASLYAPELERFSGLAFDHDGNRLAVANRNRGVHIWDLRAIRSQLRKIGLDWDPPAESQGVRSQESGVSRQLPGLLTPDPCPLTPELQVDWGDAPWELPAIDPRQRDLKLGIYSFLLTLNPWNLQAYFHRGRVYNQLGQWQKALDDLQMAWMLRPAKSQRQADILFARAEAHRGLRHLSDAIADLEEAMKLDSERSPDFRSPLAASYHERGGQFADLAQWPEAAADFARMFDLARQDDPYSWFEHAYLRLQIGDIQGYRQVCARMRERFGQSGNPNDIALLAHTCVLGPDALDEESRVTDLAEQRLKMNPPPSSHQFWSEHVMALAYYRTGQFDDAIAYLEVWLEANPHWERNVLNWLVLAMAHQQLNHGAEAQKWLGQADNYIRARTANRAENNGRFAPPGWLWRDWLGVKLLRAEFETLRKAKN